MEPPKLKWQELDFLKNSVSNNYVYPNPVEDVLMVKGANISSVTIFDALGLQVLKTDGKAAEGINVSGLKSGMYMVNVTSNKGTTTTTVIKKIIIFGKNLNRVDRFMKLRKI